MEDRKNILYKALIMLLCVLVTATVLNQYAKLIQQLINVNYDWKFEACMVIGQLVFQLPFIFGNTMKEKWNYYFNMLQVSAMGSLVIIPLLAFNYFWPLDTTLNIIYFFVVVLFMFLDHKRRVEKLGMPSFISYTWVLYRFLILIFIRI